MKIGVLGGTFDPVHAGHLYLAREVARRFLLDRILFMVAKNPPHKSSERISEAFHRYAMVVLALQQEENLFASQVELRRKGPSYTIDTMSELRESFPGSEVCFIGGSDSLAEIHLWKDCDKLFKDYCLIFVQRPGAEVDLGHLKMSPQVKVTLSLIAESDQPAVSSGRSFLAELEAPEVSSTQLRRMISDGGRPSANQIPTNVYEYIRKYQLY